MTVCQMADDPREFADDWAQLVRHVGRKGSDLVLLPEMPFYYWFCAAPKFDRKVWGEAVSAHRRWKARLPELGARAVLGSSPVDRKGKRVNEGFVWSRGGGLKGTHLKRYLPDEAGYHEASWYDRGTGGFVPFAAIGWKVGFMICSDMWSMSDARSYGKGGVGLIAVPRATGKASVEKWLAGGRTAAVVSGAYCVSSNRSGERGDATFGGRGWVVDPDGSVLGLTSEGRPFVTVDIDVKKALKAKKTYPRSSLQPD